MGPFRRLLQSSPFIEVPSRLSFPCGRPSLASPSYLLAQAKILLRPVSSGFDADQPPVKRGSRFFFIPIQAMQPKRLLPSAARSRVNSGLFPVSGPPRLLLPLLARNPAGRPARNRVTPPLFLPLVRFENPLSLFSPISAAV